MHDSPKPPDLRFRPPFCPEPYCLHHEDAAGWRYTREGTYVRKCDGRRVQRFRCQDCGRYFSAQAFHVTYWLKKPQVLPRVFQSLLECSAHRQVARHVGVSHTTVQRQALRLGRHCLLFQRLHGPRGNPEEPVVIDGFQTFELSQFWPFDLNLAVGKDSHFLYGFTDAELRRSGRMTKRQKKKRAELEELHGRPDPQATAKEVEALLRFIAPEEGSLDVVSDEHRSYPRAIKAAEAEGRLRVRHATVSSKAARTPRNPLFPVNLADLLIRHCGSNHKRETIAFSRRRCNAASRLAVFQVWRNFMKVVSERDPKTSPTPAVTLGLARRRWTLREVLSRRLFPSHVRLPGRLLRYYRGQVLTRQYENNRIHDLRFAF